MATPQNKAARDALQYEDTRVPQDMIKPGIGPIWQCCHCSHWTDIAPQEEGQS